MKKYLVQFQNYFSGVTSVEIILFHNEGQICYPLELNEQDNQWCIQLDEKPNKYQFGLNRLFPVNQVGARYSKTTNQTFSIYGTENDTVAPKPIKVLDCSTFTTNMLDKMEKRAIFYSSDQVIFVNLLLERPCTGLLAVEWINPAGELVFATDYYVEEEQQFKSYFIINNDYVSEGLWAVNLYADAKPIVQKKFFLRSGHKLIHNYVTAERV